MATTINRYSVGLSLDAKDYIDKAALSATETRRLSSAIEQARTPAEKYSREQDRLNKAFKAGAIELPVYNRLLESAKGKFEKTQKPVDEMSTGIESLTSNVRNFVNTNPAAIAGMAGIGAAAGAAYLAFQAIDKGIEILRDAQAEIDKTAKSAAKLGISFNEISGLTFAAGEIGGLDAGQVENSIKQLLIRTSKAVQGDTKINEAFARIGVDAGKAMAAGPVESIKMIAVGMEKLPTQAERLEVAMTLFGKSGADMVSTLNAGVEVLEESVAFQEKWNGLTDAQVLGVEAANDAWGRVFFIVTGLTNKLAADIAPLLLMMADKILEQSEKWENVDDSVRSVTDSVAMLYGFTVDIITATEQWGSVLAKIASGNFAGAGVTAGGMLQGAGEAGAQALVDLYKKRAELEEQAGAKDAEAARLAMMQEQTDEIGKQSDAYAQQDAHVVAYQKRLQSINDSFDKQMNGFELQRVAITQGADAAERMKLAAEGFSEAQVDALMRQNDLIDGMKSFEKETEKAMESAKKYFEDQRKRDEKMRADISKGPQSMELGSADAAKYFAEQQNAAIGAAAMPERPTPGEAEIIARAQEQFKIAKEQKAVADQQLVLLRQQLEAQRENGFRRIR